MHPRVGVVLGLALLGCSVFRAPANTAPGTGKKPAPAPQVVPLLVFGDLDAAINGPHRSPENRARDVYRHPRETLTFFGVRRGLNVIELWPGQGWYTEILAPLLRDSGKLSAAVPAGSSSLVPYKEFLAARPDLYSKVQVVEVEVMPPERLTLGPNDSADIVLTFRNMHNWIKGDFAQAMLDGVFRVLKPGGIFGVVEHRGKPEMTLAQIDASGYVPEQLVVALAEQAGFELVGRSEVNANPKDTKDYPDGVWTLPPVLRLGQVDREKYLEIGESDRMTLKFRKPEG